MFGPLTNDSGELLINSREDAAAQGRSFFYTGKPCRKRGHLSVRYVSNGCCKACLNQTFKPRINIWSLKFIPFTSSHLWTLGDLSRDERIALRVYLQRCIFQFIRTLRKDKDLKYRGEIEAAMQEMEERDKYAINDSRNMD